MAKTILLRRDADVAGRVLRFDFTVSYLVPVDADFLTGEASATLDDVERWLGRDSETIYRELCRNYERDAVDHTVSVAGAFPALAAQSIEPRFERDWERRTREAGAPFAWLTWVDLPAREEVGTDAE